MGILYGREEGEGRESPTRTAGAQTSDTTTGRGRAGGLRAKDGRHQRARSRTNNSPLELAVISRLCKRVGSGCRPRWPPGLCSARPRRPSAAAHTAPVACCERAVAVRRGQRRGHAPERTPGYFGPVAGAASPSSAGPARSATPPAPPAARRAQHPPRRLVPVDPAARRRCAPRRAGRARARHHQRPGFSSHTPRLVTHGRPSTVSAPITDAHNPLPRITLVHCSVRPDLTRRLLMPSPLQLLQECRACCSPRPRGAWRR